LKIGIVCYPTYGGSGVMATELGNGLSERGHEVHFITYQQPVRMTFHPNIYFHEVSVPTYPLFDFPPYESALTSTLVNVIQTHNLDVLHVHYAIPHASAAYFAKQILAQMGREIPFITTLHGTDITLVGKDPTYKPVVTFSMLESDAITAVSENLRDETYKSFAVGSKDILVIPNFVDLRRFRQTDKDHFKKMLAPNGERILAHTSNFRKIKRIPDVIKVFAQVRAQMPSKLLMVGDGPERQHAEELARCLGVFPDVRFLGKQDQMDEILSIADLFLLPSEYESFGLAALEAMACGVPVISSDAGGLGEINVDGQTGFLCPVGDVAMMSEKAIALLSSEETLNSFKEAALEQAARFSRDKTLALYEDLYREVIEKVSAV
jgi:N-acetyl-alpha-D-glucosaminyl L-malate synthase BshA